MSCSTPSFVTDVLATTGRLEKEDLNAKLGTLSKKTEELKAEVYDALQKKYEDFYPILLSGADLNNRVQILNKEFEKTSNKVEKELKAQLTSSATEFQDVSIQLEEANRIQSVLARLVQIDQAFHNFESSIKVNNFQQAAGCLAEVHNTLVSCAGPRDGEIKIIKALHDRYSVQSQKLGAAVATAWSDVVKWEISKDESNKDKDTIKISLRFNLEQIGKNMLGGLLQAMQDLDMLGPKLKIFGERFLENIVYPILTYKDVDITQEDVSDMCQVLYIRGKRLKGQEDIIKPKDAIESLMKAFIFLHYHFFNLQITEKIPEGNESQKVSLMRKLGEQIDEAFTNDYMIPKCLQHSIPTNTKGLEDYNKVIAVTGDLLQNSLVKQEFLLPDNSKLSDFVNDVNVLFANKKCQDLLQKARDLMTCDIHNMIRISQDATSAEVPSIGLEGTSAKQAKMAENYAISSGVTLCSRTFRLPTCCISESVQQLMNLAYQTLYEATTEDSSPQCAVQLFYSVRNVFFLFCEVVPTYHRDSLDSLPQVTALYHNNCMFMAHHLLTMGHQFRPKLPAPLNQGAATFMDLVPKLRRLGTEAFLRQMTKQRDQILEYLNATHALVSVSEDNNYHRAERAMKQILHLLQRLYNVWRDVLPVDIYHKSIGTLLNTALSDIITKITSLDDISADDATQLHTLMSILVTKAPEYFENISSSPSGVKAPSIQAQLHTHVRKWSKYEELMWVLNAGLIEISDRWADGKGPLATDFQPTEVKQLVRALFQNTDKRSKILATIK